MKFQMESQQKNQEKLLQFQKENEERILKNEEKLLQLQKENKERILKNEEKQQRLQKENEERILKNEEKQQRFFLELQKQQEALFKSLSNNQPTDSTTIFNQNAMWNAYETFFYEPYEDKTFVAYYKRCEDIYITDCADWTDAKKVWLLLRKVGTVEHNKFVDYILPKKNLRTWHFRKS